MKCKGIIKNFSQLVVSDPHYEKDVWCRYEKNIEKPETWNVEIIIKDVDEMQEYKGQEYRVIGMDFTILIKRENVYCNLSDIGEFSYKKGTKLTETKIGIDTAQVCMGVNEKATEINEYAKKINKEKDLGTVFSDYNPSFAIETMSDGILGTVKEGTKNGETSFIVITGFFDECASVNSVEELKNYIEKQLNIENLEIQKESIVQDKELDIEI
ncbi:MAG: hypothetical protein IJE59_02785 [Clostridia bacterium]|nr:hypothetical protein [Clostridia bacterium]